MKKEKIILGLVKVARGYSIFAMITLLFFILKFGLRTEDVVGLLLTTILCVSTSIKIIEERTEEES